MVVSRGRVGLVHRKVLGGDFHGLKFSLRKRRRRVTTTMMSTASIRMPFAALVISVSAQSTNYWRPAAGTSYGIDLIDTLSLPLPNVTAIDGDLFTNNGSVWASVKSAGSFENWRPDQGDFAQADIGAPLEGWEGEWWLNTTSPSVRAVMEKRMDLAVQNGCDAIDPDNVDVYNNGGGGFNLTSDDAIDYVKWLASAGHSRGLAVGLKNAGDIIPDVLADVQFAVNEQCLQYGECSTSRPFINANKPVFEIEYREDTPSQSTVDSICAAPSRSGFSTLIKHMKLNSWQIACPITSNTTTSSAPPATSSSPVNTNAGAANMPMLGSCAALLIASISFLY
nr:hypothetical protein CFP56_09474 [Quercus suber]